LLIIIKSKSVNPDVLELEDARKRLAGLRGS
jgi:hypothetical protein